MLYSFVDNVHADYVELLWEGLPYSLEHPSTLVPYPRFTKLIVGYYMTAYPEISRRVRDKYHNLEHDEMVKSIFNSGKNKARVGMKITSWMITDEMKLTENYRMSPNPDVDERESSAQQKSIVIRLCIPPRRLTRLTPPTPIPTAAEVEDMIVQDTIQLSIVEQKNHDGLEAEQNVENVKEHLAAEEIKKMVEETKTVEEDEFVNSVLNSQNDPGTRSVKGKHVEESRHTPSTTTIRSPRIHSTLKSSDTEKLRELTVTDSTHSSSSPKPSSSIKPSYSLQPKTGRFKRFHELATYLQEVMQESLPSMLDSRVKEVTKKTVPVYVAEGLILENQKMQDEVAQMVDSSIRSYMLNHVLHVHPTQASKASAHEQRDQDDHHNDAHPEGENSAKRQKISEHGTYVFGESSSGQANKSDPSPSTSGNQEQLDDFDFWTGKYATDDDELLTENVSQELVEEMSETVDEAKLRKVVDEMLRQRCTSGDEHQYHIDQMQNFLKNDIVNPKAPALSLVNQDLLYLKKGNAGPEKFVLSLHKFPAVIFPDDNIKERTSKWIFYIKRQKEPGKPKEVYSNSKIVQVIKTTGELGHEHKFVTHIIIRRANGRFSSITESDYKNLNKNDIEDMYLLCVNGKNNKKEKRVMGHQEIHKFCDATLKRVLEGLKSYNNDVKHGYVTPSISKEDVEYL
ncbi:hypothetical protein Tco_0922483 [Tanacetum coccineum]|uniref:Uncharacterized protein n=1 Tax=Tanacetum coccineum TaxID=301880 RepID=A0ABQ5D5H0_9ASTR